MDKTKVTLVCLAFFALILLQYASKPCEIRVTNQDIQQALATAAKQHLPAVPVPPVAPPVVPVPPVAVAPVAPPVVVPPVAPIPPIVVPPVVPVPPEVVPVVPPITAPVTPVVPPVAPPVPNTCPGKDPVVYKARTPEPFVLCTHGTGDMVSGAFIRIGYWYDCPSLRPVLAAIRRIVKVEGLIQVVEVGGNIGSCTFLMAAYGAHVTTYEPVMANYQLLATSAALNEARYPGRVVTVQKGCGSSPRRVTMRSEQGNMGNAVIGVESKETLTRLLEGRKVGWDEHEVEITTLDTEVKRHIHFLKMDCQGHETEALLGAKELLTVYGVDVIKAEFSNIFIESSGHKPKELLDLFHENGYAVLLSGRYVPPETFEVFARNKNTDIFAVKKSVVSPQDYIYFK